MKKTLSVLLIISLSCMVPFQGVEARAFAAQYGDADLYFSPEQLENLVAPIALYPDPLLAQVLLAATFPDQIDEAARTVRAYGSSYNVDSQPWDVSVKAVAHYPTVLSMMADKIDWTTTLGQAYVYQSSDVMEAVQRLRRQARSAGYLVTTAQQEIVEEGGFVYIYPAQPRYIYVPAYDPAIVFVARPVVHAGPVIWFSIGFLIGAWLNHDCDWGHHRVYYHGWGPGPVWVARSRPHVRITNVYVNQVYVNVNVNRKVAERRVNYGALNRYNSVHRDVDYSRVRREAGARPATPPPAQPQRDNKIIRRNMDPNDPRIDANRGRGQLPKPDAPRPEARHPESRPPIAEATRPAEVPKKPEARRPETPRPETPRPEVRRPEAPRAEARRPETPPQVRQPETPRPEARRPETPRPAQETTRPAQVPRATPPQPQQQRQPVTQRAPDSVFRGGSRTIDPRSASERGQASRQEQGRPAPTAKPAPRPQAQQSPPPARGQQGQSRERRR